VDIIRTVYYIHGPELMKLIFAVLCVMNDWPKTCSKTEVFLTFVTLIADKVACICSKISHITHRTDYLGKYGNKTTLWMFFLKT